MDILLDICVIRLVFFCVLDLIECQSMSMVCQVIEFFALVIFGCVFFFVCRHPLVDKTSKNLNSFIFVWKCLW